MHATRPLRSFWIFVLAVALLTTGLSAQDTPDQAELAALQARIAGVLRRVVPATVGLRYGDQPPGASAVIVSADGYVLTAAHCIPKVGIDVTILLPDGRELAGTTLGKNDRRDFGLVKITEEGTWPYVEMGRSAALQIEEGVLAVGHPGGFDLKRGPLVRFGWILAMSASHGTFLRTSAKVRPGDSGGPLFDLDGRVVGIHSNISTPLDANYHIPTDLFLESWDRLVAKEHWEKGGMGARPDPWEGKPFAGLRARNLDEGGIEVTAVQKKAAASKAGVRPGDVILAVDGEEVSTWRRLARWMRREKKIGDAMILRLRRGEEEFDLELTLLPKPGYEKKKPEENEAAPAKGAPELAPMEDDRFVRDFESTLDRFDEKQASWRHSVIRFTGRTEDGGEGAEILGTVVDAERGLVITKLSELDESLRAHLPDGREVDAKIVARDATDDLALVAVAGEGLVAPDLTAAAPPSGTILVAAGSRRRALGIGVVAVEPRAIVAARPGFLGVSLGAVSDEAAGDDTGQSAGARIDRLSTDGPAEKAGLEVGDIVERLDGEAVADAAALREALRSRRPGATIRLGLRRGEKSLDIEVTLGERGDPTMNGGEPRVPNGLSRRRGGFASAFRYDAPVRPRDAGAPVFDLEGRCVGVLAAQASRTHALVWPADWLAPRIAALIKAATQK